MSFLAADCRSAPAGLASVCGALGAMTSSSQTSLRKLADWLAGNYLARWMGKWTTSREISMTYRKVPSWYDWLLGPLMTTFCAFLDQLVKVMGYTGTDESRGSRFCS